MEEEKDRNVEVEHIGAATEPSADSEIARLTRENEELKALVEKLIDDRDQYCRWWQASTAERDELRNIIRPLIVYAKLG